MSDEERYRKFIESLATASVRVSCAQGKRLFVTTVVRAQQVLRGKEVTLATDEDSLPRRG